MIFGGIQKLTLIDYPGTVAATVFTVGCNFTCPFCHNPELVDGRLSSSQPKIDQADILRFFKIRSGILEGVCVTGGEPTLYPDLPDFIRELKNMGFKVKLDTNGTNPGMVKKMLDENLLDYIAMDIKAPLEKYKKVVGPKISLESIQQSVELTRRAPSYEFRTTVLPALHSRKDILSIGRWLDGSRAYYLQQFRPMKTLNPDYAQEKSFEWNKLVEICNALKLFFDVCEIRE